MNLSHEKIKSLSDSFLKDNDLVMKLVPVHNQYGNREVEGYEIYLLSKSENTYFNDEIKRKGIKIGYSDI